jgi:hypothetical protein
LLPALPGVILGLCFEFDRTFFAFSTAALAGDLLKIRGKN